MTFFSCLSKKISILSTLCALSYHPVNNYVFKVNNRNTRKRCEISSRLTTNTPEWRHWRCSGVFIANFEHISHFYRVSILNFEQVNVSWAVNSEQNSTLNSSQYLEITFISQIFKILLNFWSSLTINCKYFTTYTLT